MKRFSEQFYSKAAKVTLRQAEQRELRSRVVSYMEYHPLTSTKVAGSTKSAAIPSLAFWRFPGSLITRSAAVLSLVVLIALPFLAEKAVPGDNLYAIKVQFNEELRSTLTLSPYKKVEWETERLNRRIAEARLLANEGRLTDEVEAEMAAAVKEHTELVQQEIATLRESDVDQATLASIELSTTLAVQSDSLQEEGVSTMALALGTEASTHSTQLLVDVINESLLEESLQFSSSSLPAYDKVMARLEINTTRAYELLQSTSFPEASSAKSDIERRLEDVGRSLAEAQTIRGQNETEANHKLLDALQRTQKLIVYMSGAEVNTELAVDTIVPIILTPDEEQKAALALVPEIETKSAQLAVSTPTLTPNLAAKVDHTLAVVKNNRTEISTASSPARAKQLADESIALVNDAISLAAAEGIDVASVLLAPATPIATTTATTTDTTTENGEDETVESE